MLTPAGYFAGHSQSSDISCVTTIALLMKSLTCAMQAPRRQAHHSTHTGCRAHPLRVLCRPLPTTDSQMCPQCPTRRHRQCHSQCARPPRPPAKPPTGSTARGDLPCLIRHEWLSWHLDEPSWHQRATASSADNKEGHHNYAAGGSARIEAIHEDGPRCDKAYLGP